MKSGVRGVNKGRNQRITCTRSDLFPSKNIHPVLFPVYNVRIHITVITEFSGEYASFLKNTLMHFLELGILK